MYAIVTDNEITKFINHPKSLVIGDVRYPAKIFSVWSASELNAIGIYEVVTDSTNFKDQAYYINTNEEYNFADNQVTRSWGTATPKRLNDEKNQKTKLLLQIHDELIFETPKKEAKRISQIIIEEMSSVTNSEQHSFTIPLTVDLNIGDNWGELH